MSQTRPNVAAAAPAPFVVEPVTMPHTHTLILLHGLGSNGEKFGRELLETGIASDGTTLAQILPHAKFVFPTSRWRRSSAFGRSMLRQWFDIACLPDPSKRNELQIKGLEESAHELIELLRQEQEKYNISARNILLGGISQGCAMSLSVLLSLDYPIGGFIGLSGYLPFQNDIIDTMEDYAAKDDDEDDFFSGGDLENEPKDPAVLAAIFERDLLSFPPAGSHACDKTAVLTPVFFGHGTADEKVPLPLAEEMATTMKKAGYRVELKLYEGFGHWYKIPDEIDDIVRFIRSETEFARS
ncbi:phospholipase/carboxylesterase [Grosmannia clavigera kw1407]|uniref:Phospholipase/carboxylesterase n=1 Tax=Grosmannia clavigera (strain kw1407 / UAMH 11150) TaxID=655863 RepID=F0XEX1_GROCL|nr:phospholipase/carboxylesterase [Grosmannia clavigera kw1407]EFX04479.1 phospholipase/carboxylesterase [Grosmannia clavigera kw1407]